MNRLVWLEHIAPRFASRFSMLLLLGAAWDIKPCNFTRRCNFTTMTPWAWNQKQLFWHKTTGHSYSVSPSSEPSELLFEEDAEMAVSKPIPKLEIPTLPFEVPRTHERAVPVSARTRIATAGKVSALTKVYEPVQSDSEDSEDDHMERTLNRNNRVFHHFHCFLMENVVYQLNPLLQFVWPYVQLWTQYARTRCSRVTCSVPVKMRKNSW